MIENVILCLPDGSFLSTETSSLIVCGCLSLSSTNLSSAVLEVGTGTSSVVAEMPGERMPPGTSGPSQASSTQSSATVVSFLREMSRDVLPSLRELQELPNKQNTVTRSANDKRNGIRL